MVVLATAIRPSDGVKELAQKLSVSVRQHGFINEAHPKLRPVETNTAGVFVAGACQAPRDIPDSVAMASATGAKVLGLFSSDELEREPAVAVVNEQTCIGCMRCELVCPYGAIEQREVCTVDGHVCGQIAYVNPGVCQGCGTCQAVCLSKSVELADVHRRADLQRDQRALRVGVSMSTTDFEPRITAFVCNWCTYTGADLAGTSRLHMASNVRIIRLPCTGRIDPLFIIKAFERGADGVIVSGCHPADCHYTSGNYHARRRFAVFHDIMEFVGVDPRRMTFSWVSASEGAKWKDVVDEAVRGVRELGPYEAYRALAPDAVEPWPAASAASGERWPHERHGHRPRVHRRRGPAPHRQAAARGRRRCASSSAGSTPAAARGRSSSATRPRRTSSSSTRAACTTSSRT